MKHRLHILLVFTALIWAEQTVCQSAQIEFQKAIYLEEVHGDLDAAAIQYKLVAEDHSDNRAFAAMSLYQLGIVETKKGNQTSKGYFRRVLQEYPDQSEMARLARIQLTDEASSPNNTTEESAKSKSLLTIRKLAELEDVYGSVSPNGTYMSLVNWEDGNLAIHNLRSGDERKVTSTGTWNNPSQYSDMSVWSPGSDKLAFLWFMGDDASEIRIVDINSGEVSTVVKSPDNAFVWPYQWSESAGILAEIIEKPHNLRSLVLIDPTSKNLTTIRDFARVPTSAVQGATLSPDGRLLALTTRLTDNENKVEIFDARNPISAPLSTINSVNGKVVWASDGRSVLYPADRNGAFSLYQRSISDSGNLAPVDVVLLENLDRNYLPAVVNSRSGNLYYTAYFTQSYLMKASLDIDNNSFEASELIQSAKNALWGVAVSPDGQYLAYIGNEKSNYTKSKLTVRNLINSQEIEFTFGDKIIERPNTASVLNWTPDGQIIIKYKEFFPDQEDKDGFIRLDPLTGEQYVFASSLNSNQIVALSNHEILAYESQTGFFKYNIDSDTKSSISAPFAPDTEIYGLSLSGDQSALAFISYDNSNSETRLAVLDIISGQSRTLWTGIKGEVISRRNVPIWLPEDDSLLIPIHDKDKYQIQYYSIDRMTGTRIRWGPPLDAKTNAWVNNSIAPGTNTIYYLREVQKASVWGVEGIEKVVDFCYSCSGYLTIIR